MNAVSLFSNIGVAEAYLKEIGINVVVANELVARRAALYSEIYKDVEMICGDITQKDIFSDIIEKSIKHNVEILIATPPCQGMSTAGRQDKADERNKLIYPVIKAIEKIKPRFVFLENVPLFLSTNIEIEGRLMGIKELIIKELGSMYRIKDYIINTKDYSVPQSRERAIILMTKNDESFTWTMPKPDLKEITMEDAIGDLPPLDPYVTDIDGDELLEMFPKFYERKKEASKVSMWHRPPQHIKRQVVAMQHTPSGSTAFDNEVFYPKKENGEPVKGYHNTYKRQRWDRPAYTVTMDNRKISSQNNVHPGRLEYYDDEGNAIYSDARTLTVYEIMQIMSLPNDWNIPNNTSEAFLRRIIGEGIPPAFVKKVFQQIRE